MFDRARRSWHLLREAWEVLRRDRELVFFPILSGLCSLAVIASFLIPFFLTVPWDQIDRGGAGSRSAGPVLGPLHYGLLFLFYLTLYFVIIFFNSGLVACVRMRFAGEKPTVRDGLAFSAANIGRIFQWALLSATVGMLLKTLEERLGWLGQIVMRLLGLVWTLATTFVVPVLVHERVGPIEAVKRSAAVFKRTWGETVIANVGLAAAFNLLLLVPALAALILSGIAAAILASAAPTAAVLLFGATIALIFLYGIGLAIIQSALQGIFLTACYQYASTGEVPTAFSREYVVEAWRPKKKR